MSDRICVLMKRYEILCELEHCLRYDEFRCRWDLNSVSQVCAALQRPIISKCQHGMKFVKHVTC